MSKQNLRCPVCNSTKVCVDDVYDEYMDPDDTVVREIVGYCEKCDAMLRWKERYVFSEVFDMKEEE